jgi:hypothetical protein
VTLETWPDTEGALRDWLREQPSLQALVARRVFFGVPRNARQWPLVTVQRVGGAEDISEAPVDRALVQIDVWGEIDGSGNGDKAGTTAVVNALRSLLGSVKHRTPLNATVDALGVTVAGVAWVPDPADDRPRYVVTAEVTAVSS